jgi:hypothetical protein
MQTKVHLNIDRFGVKTYYKDKGKTIIHRDNGPAIILVTAHTRELPGDLIRQHRSYFED